MAPSPAPPPCFKPKPEWCQRFAALWAGFDDTGNEAEAIGKARELRRMAVAEKLRVIDVIGCLDVMRALDVQLMPVREQTPELTEAREKAAAYRTEAKEAMAKVTQLSEQLARLRAAAPARASSLPLAAPAGPAREYIGGLFAFAFVMAAAALLFVAVSRIAAAVFGS